MNYWGQSIASFDDLPPRDGILNPGYKLEWERFQQKIAADFLGWQAGIIRELKRPDQFITHDFAGIPTDIDLYEITNALDIPAVNIYHGMQDSLTGEEIAYAGAFVRSPQQSNYLVTETNAQTTGWSSEYQFPPYDGQLRLAAFANVAGGASLVGYWHWHSLHYGRISSLGTFWRSVRADCWPNLTFSSPVGLGKVPDPLLQGARVLWSPSQRSKSHLKKGRQFQPSNIVLPSGNIPARFQHRCCSALF